MSKLSLYLALLGLSLAANDASQSFLSTELQWAAPKIANFYVVSDLRNYATPKSGNSALAVAATVVGGWTASIPGATWIWTSNGNAVDVVFSNWFNVPGTLVSATLYLAADDDVQTYINSVTAGCNKISAYTSGGQVQCDVTGFVQNGSNQIEFWVTNSGGGPAGLLYKLVIVANLP
jgi:hypothetical protein